MGEYWTIDEIAHSEDRALACFYARLTDIDRMLFAKDHIDVYADLRENLAVGFCRTLNPAWTAAYTGR